MATPEIELLDAVVAKLTARAPKKLLVVDTVRGGQRLDAEVARQLAKLDEESAEEAESYIEDGIFEDDGAQDLVVTDCYPRDAGMASGLYQALKALRLPSGATVYFDSGEMERRLRAVSARDMDLEAAAGLGEIMAFPTYFHVGDELFEIDQHLLIGGWILEELVDHEASWIQQDELDEGEARRSQLLDAIEEAREEGDADPDELDDVEKALMSAPPWFLRLSDRDLKKVEGYKLPEPDRTPQLTHKFHPWRKPTAEMFLAPKDPSNLQHIVAAYLLAR